MSDVVVGSGATSSRRPKLRWVSTVALVLLVACSGSAPVDSTTEPATPAPTAAEPTPAGSADPAVSSSPEPATEATADAASPSPAAELSADALAPTSLPTAVHTPPTDAWGSWTLILASLETGTSGAKQRAMEVADGVAGASVIWSDDFPSLNPGHWVVHWGEFESGREASNWCVDTPDELSCYPRYLGPDVSPLASAGNAIAIDGDALVIVNASSGERRKVVDPHFVGEARFIGTLALTPDAGALFYDVLWEDAWYSCEGSRGDIERVDLRFGTVSIVAPGKAVAVSPDGRWLAVVDAQQCLPDPEEPDLWVLTPSDSVVLYRIDGADVTEVRRWSVGELPDAHDDPQTVTWVQWRPDSERIVFANAGGRVFELGLDHEGPLDAGEPILEGLRGTPRALIGDWLYVLRDETPEEWGGFDLVAVDLRTGLDGETITQMVGFGHAAADTTGTRLIWGADTQVATAESFFALEQYLYGIAW